jgi:hypothetical protein
LLGASAALTLSGYIPYILNYEGITLLIFHKQLQNILNKDHFQNLSFIKKITISLEHIVSFFNSLKNNKCF